MTPSSVLWLASFSTARGSPNLPVGERCAPFRGWPFCSEGNQCVGTGLASSTSPKGGMTGNRFGEWKGSPMQSPAHSRVKEANVVWCGVMKGWMWG